MKTISYTLTFIIFSCFYVCLLFLIKIHMKITKDLALSQLISNHPHDMIIMHIILTLQ